MSFFQELDKYLNQDFSDDYWADDAKLYAYEIVQKLEPLDWKILLNSWENRSQKWQIRCAEILDWTDSIKSIPLLFEMIQTANDELAITAVDSLNSLILQKESYSVNKETINRLQGLSKKSLLAKTVIERLLNKLY